jgi:hypothetical protein
VLPNNIFHLSLFILFDPIDGEDNTHNAISDYVPLTVQNASHDDDVSIIIVCIRE